jgi:hypothetical protein
MPITGAEPTTFVCAWCDRVYVGGEWRAAPAVPGPATTTHGICEECAGEMVPVTPRAARSFCRTGPATRSAEDIHGARDDHSDRDERRDALHSHQRLDA